MISPHFKMLYIQLGPYITQFLLNTISTSYTKYRNGLVNKQAKYTVQYFLTILLLIQLTILNTGLRYQQVKCNDLPLANTLILSEVIALRQLIQGHYTPQCSHNLTNTVQFLLAILIKYVYSQVVASQLSTSISYNYYLLLTHRM